MNDTNIGKLVKHYRMLNEINQEEFANDILISRISQNHIEGTKDISDLSNDMLFRLYYHFSKEIEDEYISVLRRRILSEITDEINKRQYNVKQLTTKKKAITLYK